MKPTRRMGLVYLGAFIVLSHRPGALAQAIQSPEAPVAAEISSSANPGINLADVDSVLRVAIPRTLQNRRQSLAYTYAVDQRNRNFSLRGKPLVDYSAKYEVIFVGDLPYRRQIEENHRPLAGTAASEEEQRLDRTFAARSRMSLDQKRDYLRRPWNIDVPLPQIPILFTSRIVGEELVDDRPAIVVESLPRPDAHPSDEEDRRALHKQVKLWIDRHDLVVSRLEATLIADDAAMKAGTVARIDFDRKDGVWLPVESDVRFEATSGSEIVRGETREANSDFHHFHVDVRLLEPAEAAAGSHQAQ